MHLIQDSSLDAFGRLGLFKIAVWNAAKYVQHVAKQKSAVSVDQKLAAATSFLRALQGGDWDAARRFQQIYPRLAEVHAARTSIGTHAHAQLQDHIT